MADYEWPMCARCDATASPVLPAAIAGAVVTVRVRSNNPGNWRLAEAVDAFHGDGWRRAAQKVRATEARRRGQVAS